MPDDASNPPDFKKLEQTVKTTKQELSQLLKERDAIEAQRVKLADEFKENFSQMQSTLEKSLVALPPNKKNEFRRDLAQLLKEQQKFEDARKTHAEGEKKNLAITERVFMYDIFLRWKAEDTIKKIKSGDIITEEEKNILEKAKTHGVVQTGSDGTEKVIYPVSSDEKLKFVAFTQKSPVSAVLTEEEQAQYELLKAIRILQSDEKQNYYPEFFTDRIALIALMSAMAKKNLTPQLAEMKENKK